MIMFGYEQDIYFFLQDLMDSGFQNMSDTARGTGLVSHVTDPPFDAASAFRIGNPASTLIFEILSD